MNRAGTIENLFYIFFKSELKTDHNSTGNRHGFIPAC
jgi:hypothetical protein